MTRMMSNKNNNHLTVDDEPPTGLHGGNGPINVDATVVSDDQNRIESQTDQFDIVILGRRHQFQGARRVASIHRYLYFICEHRKSN